MRRETPPQPLPREGLFFVYTPSPTFVRRGAPLANEGELEAEGNPTSLKKLPHLCSKGTPLANEGELEAEGSRGKPRRPTGGLTLHSVR